MRLKVFRFSSLTTNIVLIVDKCLVNNSSVSRDISLTGIDLLALCKTENSDTHRSVKSGSLEVKIEGVGNDLDSVINDEDPTAASTEIAWAIFGLIGLDMVRARGSDCKRSEFSSGTVKRLSLFAKSYMWIAVTYLAVPIVCLLYGALKEARR